jgi:hypothetical protein
VQLLVHHRHEPGLAIGGDGVDDPVQQLAAEALGGIDVANLLPLGVGDRADLGRLARLLGLVVVRGYAVDNEETAEGIVCFGVAIPRRSAAGDQYGASVTLLKARATEGRREALFADLRRLRDALVNPLHSRTPTRLRRQPADGRR